MGEEKKAATEVAEPPTGTGRVPGSGEGDRDVLQIARALGEGDRDVLQAALALTAGDAIFRHRAAGKSGGNVMRLASGERDGDALEVTKALAESLQYRNRQANEGDRDVLQIAAALGRGDRDVLQLAVVLSGRPGLLERTKRARVQKDTKDLESQIVVRFRRRRPAFMKRLKRLFDRKPLTAASLVKLACEDLRTLRALLSLRRRRNPDRLSSLSRLADQRAWILSALVIAKLGPGS